MSNPNYIDGFVAEVQNTYGLNIVGIVSGGTKGRMVRTIRLPATPELDLDWDAVAHGDEPAPGPFKIVKADFTEAIVRDTGFPITGANTSMFVISQKDGEPPVSERHVEEIQRLYLETLRSVWNEVSAQVGRAYLSSSSDVLGIRILLAAALPLIGLDHVSVIRHEASGGIVVVAQFGAGRSLQDEHLTRLSSTKRVKDLQLDLNVSGMKGYRDLNEDPLIAASGGGPHGRSSSIYINTHFYPADPVKKQSLEGIWIRGAASNRQISWEDIFLLHSLGHAVSIVVSVGSILTTRLIQLQRMTHSNGSILASMTSSLNQTSSELESLLLACRPYSTLPLAGSVTSLGLRARDHMNYIRLNVHQMQAKITLSLWLEHEAGIHRELSLERFNILESIHEIMSYAPALVESWAADYSGAAKPSLDLPSRRSSPDFFVRSRRDIFEFVLLNLLENAVKYRSSDTPTFACVIEHGRDPVTYDRTIKVNLEDDGGGITQDDVDHIFLAGWRPTRHKRSDIPGQGQGLYQSRELLNLIGGDIYLASRTNPTSFCITIPIDQKGGQ